MTTTTRKRGLIARVLAAVVSVLALVATTLAMGMSAQATPSGKIMICHATSSVANPYTTPDVDMSSVDEYNNPDLNGHGDHIGPVFDATMEQGDEWGDIIPPFTYTFTKHDVTITVTYGGLNWSAEGQAIYNNGCQLAGPREYTGEATVSGSATYCTVENETITIDYTSGPVTATSTVSQEDADALAQAEAEQLAQADLQGKIPSGATPGACQVTQSWMGEALTSGSAQYCTVEGVTVTLAYSGTGSSSSVTSQADADYQAQLIADDAAQADLVSKIPTGATPGACLPEEPETVAPVEPGTVPTEPEIVAPEVVVPEPAKVVKPATVAAGVTGAPDAAKVPVAVPAGDGSTVPQTPAWLLAMLAMGTVALLGSATRLVAARIR